MLKKLSLLYIEDDELTRLFFNRSFSNNFGKYFECSDGREGLEIYMREKPDIVITDLSLPGLPGEKLVEKILSINKEQFIIITSGKSPDMDLKENCFHYDKPVIISMLLHKIKNFFECSE